MWHGSHLRNCINVEGCAAILVTKLLGATQKPRYYFSKSSHVKLQIIKTSIPFEIKDAYFVVKKIILQKIHRLCHIVHKFDESERQPYIEPSN